MKKLLTLALVALAVGGCHKLCNKHDGECADEAAGRLNDTGITTCSTGDTNGLPCDEPGDQFSAAATEETVAAYPGQDAQHGRDLTDNDDSDGRAGFSFTKLGADGRPLDIQDGTWDEEAGSEEEGTRWSCVRDEVTQLVWEVKRDDEGVHDKDWTYSWYNDDEETNGGNPGNPNGGNCSDALSSLGYACDTTGFPGYVNNEESLCGFSDWRVPNREELRSIVDYSVARPGPTIDTGYFPNSVAELFWTSSPSLDPSFPVWVIAFQSGLASVWFQTGDYPVRLVRGGPIDGQSTSPAPPELVRAAPSETL